MKTDNERGEIATILTIGSLIVLGAATIMSSLFLKNNVSTTYKSKAAEPVSCRDNPVPAPNGYYWKADCSKSCHDNSACPQNTTDTWNVKADKSNWCYGFEGTKGTWDDWRCMMLLKTGDPSIGTPNNPQPTAPLQATAVPTAIPTTPQANSCEVLEAKKTGGSPSGVIKGGNKNLIKDYGGSCDLACCEFNGQCPSGQACVTSNGGCQSGFSCGVASQPTATSAPQPTVVPTADALRPTSPFGVTPTLTPTPMPTCESQGGNCISSLDINNSLQSCVNISGLCQAGYECCQKVNTTNYCSNNKGESLGQGQDRCLNSTTLWSCDESLSSKETTCPYGCNSTTFQCNPSASTPPAGSTPTPQPINPDSTIGSLNNPCKVVNPNSRNRSYECDNGLYCNDNLICVSARSKPISSTVKITVSTALSDKCFQQRQSIRYKIEGEGVMTDNNEIGAYPLIVWNGHVFWDLKGENFSKEFTIDRNKLGSYVKGFITIMNMNDSTHMPLSSDISVRTANQEIIKLIVGYECK